jgi:GDSL-like Lipase/Acylhydrolase family
VPSLGWTPYVLGEQPNFLAPTIAGVPGCNLWLRPGVGVQLDGNGKPTQWSDQSGAGNHVSQANPANRFTVGTGPNGLQTMIPATTVGGTGIMTTAAPLWSTTGGRTIFVVIQVPNNNPAGGGIIDDRGTFGGVLAANLSFGPSQISVFSSDTTVATLIDVPMYSTAAMVFCWRTDGNTSNPVLLNINGTEVPISAANFSSATGVGVFALGNVQSAPTHGFQGAICEVAAFNRLLGPTEIQNVASDLKQRWSLHPTVYPLTFPVPVPFKKNATIVMSGDSITRGFNPFIPANDSTLRWSVQFEASVTAAYTAASVTVPTIVDTAQTGQTSSALLSDLTNQITSQNPTDVVMMIGNNDVNFMVPRATTYSNIVSIIEGTLALFPSCKFHVMLSPFISGEQWPAGSDGPSDTQLDVTNLMIAGAAKAEALLHPGQIEVINLKPNCFAWEAQFNTPGPPGVSTGLLTQDGQHPSKAAVTGAPNGGQGIYSAYAFSQVTFNFS